MGDLFDSPWKILIVAVVLIVLFGSKKLPHAARSLGQSMRILKKEVAGLHEDETTSGSAAAPGSPAAFPAPAEIAASLPPDPQQSQIDALQQQIRDLQRSATMDAVPAEAPVPQHTQQSS
ncbi:MAG: Sec-independent protein translocase subunit TatA [Actinomycetota bacterium]|nr:Sec-independent protein translocase subunit TatA [Actinomycetota bacterium]